MSSYTIKEEQGVNHLFKDKKMMFCCLASPMLMPGQVAGTVAVNQKPCSELCTAFEATESDKSITIMLHCCKRILSVTKENGLKVV